MVYSPDPSKDTLKRRITTVLPSITTTHHDGGLPSPLSYTLADDDPPLPSIPTQRSRRNLRDRRLFRNNGWTKWEAVQLADKLEAKQEMVKADWECWKKLEERFSDSDEDDQDKARRDERMRQRWNVEPLNLCSMHKRWICRLTPSPSPQQHGSAAPRALLKGNENRRGAKGQGHSYAAPWEVVKR